MILEEDDIFDQPVASASTKNDEDDQPVASASTKNDEDDDVINSILTSPVRSAEKRFSLSSDLPPNPKHQIKRRTSNVLFSNHTASPQKEASGLSDEEEESEIDYSDESEDEEEEEEDDDDDDNLPAERKAYDEKIENRTAELNEAGVYTDIPKHDDDRAVHSDPEADVYQKRTSRKRGTLKRSTKARSIFFSIFILNVAHG